MTSSTSTESTLVVKQRTPSPSQTPYLLPTSNLVHSTRSSSSSTSSTSTAVISELILSKEEEELSIRRPNNSRRNYKSKRNQIIFVVVLAILKVSAHLRSRFILYHIDIICEDRQSQFKIFVVIQFLHSLFMYYFYLH